MNRMDMEWWRCPGCGRKLARLCLTVGSVEIKCPHCNLTSTKEVKIAGAIA